MSANALSDFPTWVREVDSAHRAALLRYAWSLCRDYALAEDAVQETFLRLCREPREKIESHLEPWLFRVCRTRVIDAQRKDGRMSELDDNLFAVAPDPTAPHPAREAETEDSNAYVLACIDRLPPAQREVVRLKFQNHLSYQEIASVTNKTVNTVGVLLHTAINSLRQILRNHPELGADEGEAFSS